jgi:threonine dehydratase
MEIDFEAAALRLQPIVNRTPLQLNEGLSKKYDCQVFLKREDLQRVRSYKIRGAYNMISTLPEDVRAKGVVCASAGNHAQGFAFSCNRLGIKGVVFMPSITPKQKITQTKMFGGSELQIVLTGDTFDDCAAAAKIYTQEHGLTFIPPFNHEKIIEGQGTVGIEILEDEKDIDYVFIPVGGGGLAGGIGLYFKKHSAQTKIIGAEPEGAASLTAALKAGQPVTLDKINRFVDGAAVKRIGDLNLEVFQQVGGIATQVPEGRICSTILDLYNRDAIVAEPAGALSIAALENFKDEIRGKKVVCIVSGSNNDIDRMPEIKELSLQYEGLKHYFLIGFSQRPGALREFLNLVLGPTDDISRFEYLHKTNKEHGTALVGIELLNKEDYAPLIQRMQEHHINYTELNKDDTLFNFLV